MSVVHPDPVEVSVHPVHPVHPVHLFTPSQHLKDVSELILFSHCLLSIYPYFLFLVLRPFVDVRVVPQALKLLLSRAATTILGKCRRREEIKSSYVVSLQFLHQINIYDTIVVSGNPQDRSHVG
jgi:hypothetical protein